jgi:uncharacterized protein (TIRG00374 family)
LYILRSDITMEKLLENLPETIHFAYIPVLLLIVLFHFLAEPLRWYFYTNKSFNTNYKQLFSIFSLTALISYILPMKMGIPTRMLLIRIKTGIKILQCSALLMLDGIINYACWGVTSVIGIGLLTNSKMLEINVTTISIVLVFVVLLLFFLWNKRRFIIPSRSNDKLKQGTTADKQGIKYLVSNIRAQGLFFATFVMLLDISSHVMRHWIMFSMLDINLSLSVVFIITTVSVFAGIISMMPLGLGGYDAMLIFLLSQFSIAPEYAISIAILNRFSSLMISFLIGLYGGAQLNLNPFKTNWRKMIADSRQ